MCRCDPHLGSRRNWVGHGLATGLAIHAHFFAALVYLAQMLTLPLAGQAAARWRGFLGSAAIIFAFLTPIFLLQPLATEQLLWVQPLTLRHLYSFVALLAGGRPSLLLYAVFCVLALIPVVRVRPERAPVFARWSRLYVAGWILVPVLVVVTFSLLVKPAFVDRYLIVSLPALTLLGGAGIARVRPSWLCVPILILFLGASARGLDWWYHGNKKSDWRGVTAYVLSQAQPGDAAVFYVYNNKHCFDYYRDRLGAGNTGPRSLDLSMETRVNGKLGIQVDPQRLSSLPAQHERVWLILAHDFALPSKSDRAQILAYLENNYVKLQENQITRVKVLLYARPESLSREQSRALWRGTLAHAGAGVACVAEHAVINEDGVRTLYGKGRGSGPPAVGSSGAARPRSGPGNTS